MLVLTLPRRFFDDDTSEARSASTLSAAGDRGSQCVHDSAVNLEAPGFGQVSVFIGPMAQ